MTNKMIGIVGGVGSYAGIDLIKKVIKVKLKYDGIHDINLKMIHKIINNIKSVKNK